MLKKIKDFLFVNQTVKQTVVKNTFWLIIGETVGRVLKLLIIIFATRKLGLEDWGVFSYALAFVSLFFVLGDFGINTFITKEMSKGGVNKYRYLGASIMIRITFLVIFFSLAILLGPVLGKIKLGFNIICIFATFFLFESIREFAMSINRSLEKMETEGLSKILINLTITTFGFILLIKIPDPISLAVAYMLGSVVSTFYILWSIRKELLKIEWKFSRGDFKVIYNFSWPILIISLFGFLFSLDTIMLGQMRSAVEVSLYTTPQRLISFLAVVPSFIGISMFPILSKNENDNEKLGLIFGKVMKIILAVGVPLTIGGIIFNKEITLLVLGQEYIGVAPVFSILMISILASFPNIFLINLIFTKNLQRSFIMVTSFGVFLNIFLNFLLIPKYGAIGAAISTTVAELLIMSANWKKLQSIIPFSVLPKLGKVIVSSVMMTLIILACNYLGFYFIFTIVIAITTYIVFLKILREPMIHEISSLVKLN